MRRELASAKKTMVSNAIPMTWLCESGADRSTASKHWPCLTIAHSVSDQRLLPLLYPLYLHSNLDMFSMSLTHKVGLSSFICSDTR